MLVSSRIAESLPVLQAAITEAERLLGLEAETEEVAHKRARTEIRLDSGWEKGVSASRQETRQDGRLA